MSRAFLLYFVRRYILNDRMQKTLFTIGHSTHSVEYFISLLKKHDVRAIYDVRSMPYSRHNPQFNREPLTEQLCTAGISYFFLGKELGARSDNPACYIGGKVQYNYLVDEPSFQQGLRRVRKGIEDCRSALMCAEREPLSCHRTILIGRELREPDLNIEHILADGSVEENSATERRLMKILNIVPDMLLHERDCIEEAYEKQARNIAYVIPPQHGRVEPKSFGDENLYNRIYE